MVLGGALEEKCNLCPRLWSLSIPRFHFCLVGPVGDPVTDGRSPADLTVLQRASRLTLNRAGSGCPRCQSLSNSLCWWIELCEGRDRA